MWRRPIFTCWICVKHKIAVIKSQQELSSDQGFVIWYVDYLMFMEPLNLLRWHQPLLLLLENSSRPVIYSNFFSHNHGCPDPNYVVLSGQPWIMVHDHHVILACYSCIYIYSAELYPTSCRNTGFACCVLASRIAGIIVPKINQGKSTRNSRTTSIAGPRTGRY